MNLDKFQIKVLSEAIRVFEECGDDTYLDILDDYFLRKAFDELKEACLMHNSHDNTHLAESMVEEEEDELVDVREVPNDLLIAAVKMAEERNKVDEKESFKQVRPLH